MKIISGPTKEEVDAYVAAVTAKLRLEDLLASTEPPDGRDLAKFERKVDDLLDDEVAPRSLLGSVSAPTVHRGGPHSAERRLRQAFGASNVRRPRTAGSVIPRGVDTTYELRRQLREEFRRAERRVDFEVAALDLIEPLPAEEPMGEIDRAVQHLRGFLVGAGLVTASDLKRWQRELTPRIAASTWRDARERMLRDGELTCHGERRGTKYELL